jgi:16S rRNA pseudouridine516 synthase
MAVNLIAPNSFDLAQPSTIGDMKTLALADLLFSQGFGTRRVCAGLVQQRLVTVAGRLITDAAAPIDAADGLSFTVQGHDWRYYDSAVIVLNKPAGHECSQKPSAWPSIYSLLPIPLRMRPSTGKQMGVQAVGRLDQDTTGLLLLTDNGQLLHRMAAPKNHVPKVYQVQCKHPVTTAQIDKLLAGVVLDDDPKPVRASACLPTGECSLALTLTQGKYHQVKRMLAAVGNRVEQLHRSQVGQLHLPADLAPGQWRWLDAAEVAAMQRKTANQAISP